MSKLGTVAKAEMQEALEHAKTALKQGDYAGVRRILSPIASVSAKSAATFFLARAEFQDGNLPEATRLIVLYRSENPQHEGAMELHKRITLATDPMDPADADDAPPPEPKRRARQATPLVKDGAAYVSAAALAAIAVLDAGIDAMRGSLPDQALISAARTLAAEQVGPQWQNDVAQAKVAFFAHAADPVAALTNYDPHLIEVSVAFDYITWPRRIQDHVRHKKVLDVGCGFGGYGMGFLVAGATSYAGLDPEMRLDSTRAKNKRTRTWADMGITPREIAAKLPAIRLYEGTAESITFEEQFDMITLHNVTEHLMQIGEVFAGLVPLCRTDTPIVYLHHNFYCWNGHHFTPNQPHQLDEADPEHQLVYDWNHIETLETVPDDHYFKTHLNRIMLDEIHAVTLKYFDIDVWDEIPSSKATLARLTPEVIERVHKTRPDVTERDMRVNAVYCVARTKAGTQINH